MIDTRKQLEWVQRNRGRAYQAPRLDELVEQFSRQVRVVDVELLSAAAAVVAGVIEPSMKPHCRIAAIRGGLLTIHADQPALLFPLKQRFAAAIERRLGQSRKTAGLRKVSFQWGTEGMPLMDAP